MTKYSITKCMVFCLIILCINGLEDNVPQISVCTGNCMYCKQSSPGVCLDQNLKVSNQSICLPFYRGSSCNEQAYAYENVLRQNGSFEGWNANRMSSCQLVQKNAQGQLVANQKQAYMGLGPMKSSQSLFRVIQFNNTLSTNRAIIKFSLAVDDPTLQAYFLQPQTTTTTTPQSTNSTSSSTQTRTQTLPDGTIVTYIITTTNTTTTNQETYNIQESVAKGRQFLYVELIDSSIGSAPLIERKAITYNSVSSVRTSCGIVYTYLLGFDLSKQYSQLTVRFSFVNPSAAQKDALWSILSFDFSLGCRGFVVSSNTPGSYNCDACLSGFYPVYSLINEQVEECRACDFRCKTCLSGNLCLTCIQNTVLDANTGMCQFLEYFQSLASYSIISGKTVDSGRAIFGSQVIKSENGILEVRQPLSNTQSYTVAFDFLYSAAFRNSAQTVKIIINGKEYSFNSNSLPLNAPSLVSGISSSSQAMYQTRLSYTVDGISETNYNSTQGWVISNGTTIANGTNSTTISDQTKQSNIRLVCSGSNVNSGTGQQVAITNLNVVQFQCSKNCLECTYNQFTKTSECTKCAFFFDNRESNCLNCANGFFLTVINSTEQCIKCHSTCKQCLGQQITSCLQCFDGFKLGEPIYDYQCINCIHASIYSTYSGNTSALPQCKTVPKCLSEHPQQKVLTQESCQKCLSGDKSQLTSSETCKQCWLKQQLARSSCEPIPERGYQSYGSDISEGGVISSQWASDKILVRKNITDNYKDWYGIDYDSTYKQQTSQLTFTQPFLPNHRGLTIFFNIFKLNYWSQISTVNPSTNATITISPYIIILIRSNEKFTILNKTINVSNLHGNNIYGGFGSGNEMIYTFVGNSLEHSYNGKLEIIITASHTGIFVRDLEVYLGNCNQCNGNRMNYQVYYIPMYSNNATQTGLDVWITFNQDVKFQYLTGDPIFMSFKFSIDQLGYQNQLPFTILEEKINLWNYVKYFIPINGSLCNATLRINNTLGHNIYSKISKASAYLNNPLVKFGQADTTRHLMSVQGKDESTVSSIKNSKRLLLNERLSSTNVETKIHRYEDIVLDERKSMEQLDSFFEFFQWFTVLTMIVFAFFGLGIIFEEFSILIQLLFLHIYISTYLLPATFKQPLSHMQKMEDLNFFAYPHARHIEDTWFDKVVQQSPYPLTQYNIDVYFARSFYSIIIVNLIYLFWFLVLFLCLKLVRPFKTSSNKVLKFFRDIPRRPMNYFDQIWRYQFITTMWASFMQFHNFDGPTAEMRLNLALCIASFVISLIWPVFVMVYTYHQHLVISVEHFLYLYNDIYYRKISSTAEKTSYYMYIAVRFGRYFFYALFIAVFIFQNIIGPVILMAVTLLEIIYLINFQIFRDKVYLMFKLIQNVGFIIVEILLLIIYGFSDDTITKEGFISIGYGLDALYILMIINGIARFFYLGYKKIRDFLIGRYDYGETGQLENYDHKYAIQVPNTERGLGN